MRFPKKPKFIQTDTDELESVADGQNKTEDPKIAKNKKDAKIGAKRQNEFYLLEFNETEQVIIF